VTISFRPAVRSRVGLIIGLIGPSGSGKTFSAMRFATGLSPGKRFAVIDTEAGRALHYADQFQFDHGDMKPPFRPDAYADAILAADGAGYGAIIVDSFSHEHAGDGGLLDWQEEEVTRMAGDDWKKREAVKMAAWVKPKMAHKAMMQRLLQVRAHLILCFRAEEKIEMVRGQDGKMEIQPKRSLTGLSGWIPICEKTVPYELTASLLLTPDRAGVPQPIKLQEQHRAFFPLDQPITEQSGEQVAAWARGAHDAGRPAGSTPAPAPAPSASPARAEDAADPKRAALANVAIARTRLGYPEAQWVAILKGKLGTTVVETADVVALDETLLPFLRRLARKDASALDEVAKILAGTRAA